MSKRFLIVSIALLSLFTSFAATDQNLDLNLDRSFVVTDRDIVAGFRFERVLDTLAQRSGVASLTGEQLFRQWFDTQNPAPGLDPSMPHCDEPINGFARRCPTQEGVFATAPYVPDDFVPIALINRFDLADPAGAHCGQYRLIFANRNTTAEEVFHIIFEPVLPNPRPQLGVEGCRGVAQFWASLSDIPSMTARRERLEQFFFEGVSGYAPVIDPAHFAKAPGGVRSFQFRLPIESLGFFQWRLVHDGARLYFQPDVLENLPAASLINANNTSDQAVRFREVFLQNVPTLAIRDVNAYHMRIPDEFLVPDADPGTPGIAPFQIGATFNINARTPAGAAYRDRIAAELQKIGSTLTPQQIVLRAETQTCVGCHFLGAPVGEGVEFPAAFDFFQHVTEDQFENGEGGPGSRYAISPAIRNTFGPNRIRILRDFIVNGTPPPVHSN